MSKLVLPEIKTLFIIADHDTPRPIGYECAHTLAVRAIKSGIKVHLWQPTTQGFDALDELNALKGETA